MYQSVKYFFLLLFVLSSISSNHSFAQTEKKYSESMQEVNEYLLANEFTEALPILKDLVKEGYQNANMDYKLGLCYLNSYKERSKAMGHLKNATAGISESYLADNGGETSAPLQAWISLGDAYRYEGNFKEAERAYRVYLNRVVSNPVEREVATKRLEECHIAKVLMKNPIPVKLTNIGNIINSGLSDFNGCLSGNGKVMVFTRRLKFYDAIFYCTRTATGWSEPENITTQIGSDGEFHPTGLSFDGSRMLLMSFTHLNGYDLFESLRLKNKWGKVAVLNSLNTSYHDIDAVYAPDGKSVFFSSNRINGLGGYDLYESMVGEDGTLGQPRNLGTPINTIWDEKTPSLYQDGIIFSSQRKPGMGGYDLFYANKKSDRSWGCVYNIGYPVNTADDDKGLQLTLNGADGTIARHDPEGFTDIDIFQVQANSFSKFRMIPAHGEIEVNGKEKKSTKGLVFYLVDESIQDTINEIVEPDSGKFDFDIYPGKFQLVMSSENKKSISQSFTVPSDLEKPEFNLVSAFTVEPEILEPVVLAQNAHLNSSIKADTIQVADIYFDFNQFMISSQEYQKLSKLVSLLGKYKLRKIELIGYTDSKGSADYNVKLSVKRANEVLNCFIKNGISPKLISVKGIGSVNYIARNSNSDGSDNMEGRAYNRRVEMIIVPTDSSMIIKRKKIVPKELYP
jgi:outer membrane protein OmpA-like peptidoglycan-associated protein